jgi:selenide, water dikinase
MSGLLPPQTGSANVIIGYESFDDAAVVRLEGDDERYLVLTTDTIAPLVDEPEVFGAIAAANALSDIYAMGGKPLYALGLLFFPDDRLPLEVAQRITKGAQDLCSQVGVPIVGGHSVRNPDLKYGLAVTGEVKHGNVLSNQGGRAGDALVLTKALGTGVIASALKQRAARAEHVAGAIASMMRLNRAALEVARQYSVTACTDVTGYGLLGHLMNILRNSRLDARLELEKLPLLEGAVELAGAGHVPGGTRSTLRTLQPHLAALRAADPQTELLTLLAADAQTSGGLLLCLPAEHQADAVSQLQRTGHQAACIGTLGPSSGPHPVIHLN